MLDLRALKKVLKNDHPMYLTIHTAFKEATDLDYEFPIFYSPITARQVDFLVSFLLQLDIRIIVLTSGYPLNLLASLQQRGCKILEVVELPAMSYEEFGLKIKLPME